MRYIPTLLTPRCHTLQSLGSSAADLQIAEHFQKTCTNKIINKSTQVKQARFKHLGCGFQALP